MGDKPISMQEMAIAIENLDVPEEKVLFTNEENKKHVEDFPFHIMTSEHMPKDVLLMVSPQFIKDRLPMLFEREFGKK